MREKHFSESLSAGIKLKLVRDGEIDADPFKCV